MPRATACSSSTMRMVAATRAMLHRRPPSGIAGAGDLVVPCARSGRLAIRPRRRAAARRPDRHADPEVPHHAHRPRDAGRRTPRHHRQEGRPPPPVRPPAGASSTATASSRPTSRSTPTNSSSSAGTAARTPWSTCRSTARRPSPVLVTASRSTRSIAGPLHVDLFLVRMTEELTVDVPLVATGKSHAVEQLRAARSSTRASRCASGRCRTTCPQSIEYSVESLVDFDDDDPRPRPRDPGGRDAADRRRRDHRQGPGTARRGGRGSRGAEGGEGAEGEEGAEGAEPAEGRPPRRSPTRADAQASACGRSLRHGVSASASAGPLREHDREPHASSARLTAPSGARAKRREDAFAHVAARARRTGSPRRIRPGNRCSRRP